MLQRENQVWVGSAGRASLPESRVECGGQREAPGTEDRKLLRRLVFRQFVVLGFRFDMESLVKISPGSFKLVGRLDLWFGLRLRPRAPSLRWDGTRLMVSGAGAAGPETRGILALCSRPTVARRHQVVIIRGGESFASGAESAEVIPPQTIVAAGESKDELPEYVEPAERGIKHGNEVQFK